MTRPVRALADRVLERLAPRITARADDCSYEQRCRSKITCPDGFVTQEREVCAGWQGPGYGPWYDLHCYC